MFNSKPTARRPARYAKTPLVPVAALLFAAPLAGALDDTGAGAAGDSVVADVLQCKSIAESADRLLCFDTLAEAVSERDTANSGSAGDEAGEQVLPPLRDDVGKAGTGDEPAEEYSGRVTSCEISEASGRWIFTFDNGQIWRQSNIQRLPFRECDFAVTLRRDVFGYKLEIPSANRSVRVARLR
jgi:hypothetical protein